MDSNESIKDMVKEKYGEIAGHSKEQNLSTCCGSTCGCSNVEFSVMAEDYSSLTGYLEDADLALGCGLPTEFADIRPGETVVDLGSGAGIDCFVARSLAGESGHVIGIDMTESMVQRARENTAKLGYQNVEFRLGEIENIPIENNTADVVVSNCVMNLVPDKAKAFSETFRIIRPAGRFTISDIVLVGELPKQLQDEAALYAGCIAGAVQKSDYCSMIVDAGFENVIVRKDRQIDIPNEILARHLSLDQLREFKRNRVGIFSITVCGNKPSK